MKRRILSVLLALVLVSMLPVFSSAALAVDVPAYITAIGIERDASLITGADDAKEKLRKNGFTVIDRDLNDDADGEYIYMGYKTSSDYTRAITGVLFRTGKNPPNSLTYENATFYLVGGSYESNGTGDGAVDLNEGAGGDYIYTYITRDTNYNGGYAITGLSVTASGASSTEGVTVAKNTSGSAQNLNSGTGDKALYLHCNDFRTDNSSNVFVQYI